MKRADCRACLCTLAVGLLAWAGPGARAEDDEAFPTGPAAFEALRPLSNQATEDAGERPEPIPPAAGRGAASPGPVGWVPPGDGMAFMGFREQGFHTGQLKRLLGPGRRDDHPLRSQELMLKPGREGVVVGFRLTW